MSLDIGSAEHVALWDAINALVDASGGRNGVSTARMTAVAKVESALRTALAEEGRAMRYATELARNIWEREWKQTAPNWEPLPDLLGVLTQIDNMTSGMSRAALAEAEKAEPRRELSDEASLELAEWLAREMPPGTVINDPRWWAPRIVSAVLRAAWGKR